MSQQSPSGLFFWKEAGIFRNSRFLTYSMTVVWSDSGAHPPHPDLMSPLNPQLLLSQKSKEHPKTAAFKCRS